VQELETLLPPLPHTVAEDKYLEVRRRGIQVLEAAYDVPRDIKIYSDSEGLLHTSVLFLYDEFGQTDFVDDVREDQTLATQLADMLPAPWDTTSQLVLGTARAYFEREGRYHEVSVSASLMSILKQENYAMPGVPTFHVVSRGFKLN
jgi:hypothetical protein